MCSGWWQVVRSVSSTGHWRRSAYVQLWRHLSKSPTHKPSWSVIVYCTVLSSSSVSSFFAAGSTTICIVLCDLPFCKFWYHIETSAALVELSLLTAGIRMEWSNDGELLAVAGYVRLPDHDCRNELRFYRRSSKLQLALVLPTQVWLHSLLRILALMYGLVRWPDLCFFSTQPDSSVHFQTVGTGGVCHIVCLIVIE